MARTIAVSDDVYELLQKFKLPGASFSGVIRRGLKGRGNLADLAGRDTISKEDVGLAPLHSAKAHETTTKDLPSGVNAAPLRHDLHLEVLSERAGPNLP